MNDTIMEYKNYSALIQYSDDDGCYIGKVVGIQDQIIFDGSSLDEIRKTFEEDVDSYIQYCGEKGREPNPPAVEVMIPVSPVIYAKASRIADNDGVSVRAVMEIALQQFVEHVASEHHA
jgi:predicted HicB family RNase H-like nuclease